MNDLTTWAESASKFSALLEMIYVDGLQPGVKQVGTALENVLGFGNTLLLPLALTNEASRYVLQRNMNRFREKAKEISIEQVSVVPPEIGVPVVEKLMYVQDEKLVDLYTELLTAASDKARVSQAHPSFVSLIGNLTPDEAVLLKYFALRRRVPILFAHAHTKGKSGSLEIGSATPSGSEEGLEFPENMRAYIANFNGLGILNMDAGRWLTDDAAYKEIEDGIRPFVENQFKDNPHLQDRELKFRRGLIEVTPFGEVFLNACVRPAMSIEKQVG